MDFDQADFERGLILIVYRYASNDSEQKTQKRKKNLKANSKQTKQKPTKKAD